MINDIIIYKDGGTDLRLGRPVLIKKIQKNFSARFTLVNSEILGRPWPTWPTRFRRPC